MFTALLTGLGIGLAAGVSPGPLLVLVVTSALRGGLRAGLAAAAAPLISDLVVVTVVLLVLRELNSSVLGWLGVLGGLAIIGVGVQTFREGRTARLRVESDSGDTALRRALGQAVLVNLISPHPWISWITALGPLTISAWRADPAAGVAVVVGFYLTLVGAKAALAAVVVRGRGRLSENGYRRTVMTAGVSLVALGALMFVEFGRQLL